jgi:hypothetical protein
MASVPAYVADALLMAPVSTCRELFEDPPHATVLLGDQADPAFWKKVMEQHAAESFDIILDDGGDPFACPYMQLVVPFVKEEDDTVELVQRTCPDGAKIGHQVHVAKLLSLSICRCASSQKTMNAKGAA